MPLDAPPPPTMTQRIERVLLLLAYFIEQDGGEKSLPMYEQFERELAQLKDREDTRARARRRLLAYTDASGLRAIR